MNGQNNFYHAMFPLRSIIFKSLEQKEWKKMTQNAKENLCLTCTDCGTASCSKGDGKYPEFCLTTHLTDKEIEKIVDLYNNNEEVRKIAIAGAEVEGAFYGKYTRVEEIMEFARRIGAKKIGIATCSGLINESRIFARILKIHGFEVYGVACKVGAIPKTDYF